MFSRAGSWTIITLSFLLVWALTIAGARTARDYLVKKVPAAPAIQKSFTFAEPTAEELHRVQEDAVQSDMIAIPIKKALTLFACPKKTCAKVGTVQAGEDLTLPTDSAPDADGWISIQWKNPKTGRATKVFVSVSDITDSYQTPPPPPTAGLDPTTLVPEKENPVEPVAINPQTLVGIACDFESDDLFHDRKVTRGSGAIITEDGYIITARSVVDLGYLNDGLDNFKLKQCYVGQLPESSPLPSESAIRKINAFVRVPYLSYLADVAYIPTGEDASDYENAWMDFALLKIEDINPDVKYFGGPTHLPESFPVAPFLISELPKIGDATLNFAFPSGTTLGNNADLKTLFMQGLISSVTGYWAGDKRYADSLFLIESHLDTEDTAGGRFGSPIFWKGYVVGVHTAKQQSSRQIYNVSAKAVLSNLFDNQFIIPINVQ